MFPNTLLPATALALAKLKNFPFLADFYLGGGTALALQLGHRKSLDLDFFIEKLPPREKILANFKNQKISLLLSDETGLNLNFDNTKISFLQYPYPVLKPHLDYEGIKLSSVLDIACMKLNAVTQRGEKKDFYDVFEIFKTYSLDDLITAFGTKFKKFNYQKTAILKSLVYFDDAEKSDEPIILNQISWDEVKNKLLTEATNYSKKQSNF